MCAEVAAVMEGSPCAGGSVEAAGLGLSGWQAGDAEALPTKQPEDVPL